MSNYGMNWTAKLNDLVTPAVNRIIARMQNMGAAAQASERAANSAANRTNNAVHQFALRNQNAMAAAEEIPGVSRALSVMKNPYLIAASGATVLAAGAYKAVDSYYAFEKSMAKVNATAHLSKDELQRVSNEVLAIGSRSTAALDDVPLALNRIVSAGVELPDAMKMLEPTLQAAKAGFTDVETVASAAVNVMNSSGVKNANVIYDKLFATLRVGNAEFADIANYLPKIVPAAITAGGSLDDVAGAFAYLTSQGQSAEASTTLLQNAYKALADPSKLKAFKAIGVDVYDSNGKMRKLTDITQQFSKSLGGLSPKQKALKLETLNLDQEASAAFSNLITDTGKLKDSIDAVTKSQGELNKTVEATETNGDKLQKLGNKLQALGVKIGGAIATMLNPILDALNESIDAVPNMIERQLKFEKNVKAFQSGDNSTFYGGASSKTEREAMLAKYEKATEMARKAGDDTSIADKYLQRERERLKNFKDAAPSADQAALAGTTNTGALGLTADSSSRQATNQSIIGGGKETKNVNVTIGKLVETFNINVEHSLKEGETQAKRVIEDLFVTGIRDAEKLI